MTARVLVNRLWHYHFNRGIVATPNDFGAQGAPPTHPELLDWFAAELIRGGWRLKPIHQLIMTSGVYQQDTSAAAAKLKADPSNALLSRHNQEVQACYELALGNNPKLAGNLVLHLDADQTGAIKGAATEPKAGLSDMAAVAGCVAAGLARRQTVRADRLSRVGR